MKLLRAGAGVVVSALALIGLAGLAYRAYAPGPAAERLHRARLRWEPFTAPSTWSFLARGFGITLRLALLAVALSLVFGVGLALVRLSQHRYLAAPFAVRALRTPIVLVIESIRSSPLFMLVIYVFIGMPKLGVNLSPFWAGVSALTLYTSCVLSEIVRAGILSLDRGQFEAAAALGLGYGSVVSRVVLPQALRRMVPAIVSQLVTLIKDTSLVSFITVVELARRAHILEQVNVNPIETYLVVMAIYFVINFALSELARRLELRPGRIGRAAAPVTIGQEDQVPAAP
jgi:His/Glu/Gln/Arg/opine family amino acid ABC transporter permease subunit